MNFIFLQSHEESLCSASIPAEVSKVGTERKQNSYKSVTKFRSAVLRANEVLGRVAEARCGVINRTRTRIGAGESLSERLSASR